MAHKIFKLLFLLLVLGYVPPTVNAEEYEDWMGTYYQGKKLGFSNFTFKRSGDIVVLNSKVFIRLQSRGIDQSTSFTQQTELSLDWKVKNFSLLQEIMGNRQKVEGDVRNGKLFYHVTSLGFDKKDKVSFPADMALTATFLFNIVKEGLKVGKRGTLPVFIEPYQIPSTLEYRILRKETIEVQEGRFDTFVIHHRISGIESTLWVTESGRVIRERSPQGFESVVEPEHVARDLGDEVVSVGSIITLSLVKLKHAIRNSKDRHTLKLKMSKVGGPDLVPQDHRQKILNTVKESDGTFMATILINSEPRGVTEPALLPISQFNGPDFLGDTPEVQKNHPQIRALARELVGDLADSWRAARDINLWVYMNLEKVLADTVTAVDALRERRGECQSHTYLFAAIARAAGIPTKIVNGLVYSSQYNGFLYHAWPEVYVGEWRALDPTLGQHRVDATHIKLSESGDSHPFKLMEFIGKIQIETIEN